MKIAAWRHYKCGRRVNRLSLKGTLAENAMIERLFLYFFMCYSGQCGETHFLFLHQSPRPLPHPPSVSLSLEICRNHTQPHLQSISDPISSSSSCPDKLSHELWNIISKLLSESSWIRRKIFCCRVTEIKPCLHESTHTMHMNSTPHTNIVLLIRRHWLCRAYDACVWRAYNTQFSRAYYTHLPQNPNHTHCVSYARQSQFLRINSTPNRNKLVLLTHTFMRSCSLPWTHHQACLSFTHSCSLWLHRCVWKRTHALLFRFKTGNFPSDFMNCSITFNKIRLWYVVWNISMPSRQSSSWRAVFQVRQVRYPPLAQARFRLIGGCLMRVKNNHLLSAPQSAQLPFPGFCRTCLRVLAARSLSVIGPVERRSGGSVSPQEEREEREEARGWWRCFKHSEVVQQSLFRLVVPHQTCHSVRAYVCVCVCSRAPSHQIHYKHSDSQIKHLLFTHYTDYKAAFTYK